MIMGNYGNGRGTTVLSGAEERFAEERPGWNFSKNKNDPGLEN